LPKLSAFKQYYLRKQELVYCARDTATYCDVAYPPPNSSSSFEVSAILVTFVCTVCIVTALSSYIISMSLV